MANAAVWPLQLPTPARPEQDVQEEQFRLFKAAASPMASGVASQFSATMVQHYGCLQDSASDLLVEGFLKLRRKINDGIILEKAYVRSVFTNLAINIANKEKRQPRSIPMDNSVEDILDGSVDSEDHIIDQMSDEQVYEVARKLFANESDPDKANELFTRCMREDSYVSIGRDLGMTPDAVRMRYNRLTNKLKSIVEDYLTSDDAAS